VDDNGKNSSNPTLVAAVLDELKDAEIEIAREIVRSNHEGPIPPFSISRRRSLFDNPRHQLIEQPSWKFCHWTVAQGLVTMRRPPDDMMTVTNRLDARRDPILRRGKSWRVTEDEM
jgi:hypothetical protein